MRMIVDVDVPVQMRDGVALATDVYRPDPPAPGPALVQGAPHGKDASRIANHAIEVKRAVAAGYAFVLGDCRGRFGSDGAFTPFAHEGADGADTVAWVASQPWCTGDVGLAG